jgi:hypothetical protein
LLHVKEEKPISLSAGENRRTREIIPDTNNGAPDLSISVDRARNREFEAAKPAVSRIFSPLWSTLSLTPAQAEIITDANCQCL